MNVFYCQIKVSHIADQVKFCDKADCFQEHKGQTTIVTWHDMEMMEPILSQACLKLHI